MLGNVHREFLQEWRTDKHCGRRKTRREKEVEIKTEERCMKKTKKESCVQRSEWEKERCRERERRKKDERKRKSRGVEVARRGRGRRGPARGLVACNLRPLKTRWETARLLCLNGIGDGVCGVGKNVEGSRGGWTRNVHTFLPARGRFLLCNRGTQLGTMCWPRASSEPDSTTKTRECPPCIREKKKRREKRKKERRRERFCCGLFALFDFAVAILWLLVLWTR